MNDTWTSPLKYILTSSWFFCHLVLDDGNINLAEKKPKKKTTTYKSSDFINKQKNHYCKWDSED